VNKKKVASLEAGDQRNGHLDLIQLPADYFRESPAAQRLALPGWWAG